MDTSTIPASGPTIRSLTKTARLDTDVRTAWEGWASAEGLTAWWQASETKIDLRIGGPFEIYFDMDAEQGLRGSEGCRYLSYVPGEMVSFTWNAPPHLPLRSANTWVVVTFTATADGGTEIRLVHTGFLDGADWDDYRNYFDSAWEFVLGLQQQHHANPTPDHD
jgi:uncharacterized protein YndB with AHSA1/START domain